MLLSGYIADGDLYSDRNLIRESIPRNIIKFYNKIFRRFYRSSNAAQTEGSGLGLYLAQLILNNEKGYVTAVSRPGEGSSFRIFLLNEVLTVL